MNMLPKCDANYVPLSPITFLKRASDFYFDRTSIIYKDTRFTWYQTYSRCRRLASFLRSLNIHSHYIVSVLAPNIPALYEMHFAVPMAGGVLNAINTRLDAKCVATVLRHSEAKVFFVDYQYIPLASEALRLVMTSEHATCPIVVAIDDIDSPTGAKLGEIEYEEMIFAGDPNHVPEEIGDELAPIALNYTSGTTSAPKGAVYSHRGAYLSTLSLLIGWEVGTEPVYLWTLPMFHCNGWTLTWGIAARGGTNVCLRHTTARDIHRSIALHRVTHMCCAPVVFTILLEADVDNRRVFSPPVEVLTGGAPPPAALLEKIEPLGFHVSHAYGLTEATGPALVCEWQKKWNNLARGEQSKLKARQGMGILTLADVDVKNHVTMRSVPRDGKTMGEIMLRGSTIMKGYFKDPDATSAAFRDGWFLTGDVGVIHPDGYVEIRDRSKDVIISGGENVSSVEVESVLYAHPRILEAAAVAMPHPRWGETPCAFVAVKKNAAGRSDDVSESDVMGHCRRNLPGYMVPGKVVFVEELPKTATGKVQKHELRVRARAMTSANISDNKKEKDTNKSCKNINKSEQLGTCRNNRGDEDDSQQQILALSRL